jgi:Fe-S cluster assembly iron-binding protein IscA
MFNVTDDAVSVLKAAKKAEGAPPDAGIRVCSGGNGNSSEPLTRIGFAISDDPYSGDEEFEQDGLRIFVEETLVEPLEDRTLDVEEADDGAHRHLSRPILPARLCAADNHQRRSAR